MKISGDESEDAFSGQTVPLGVEESSKVSGGVVAYSRKSYAIEKREIEEYMETLFEEDKSKGAITVRKKTRSEPKLHDV